MNANQLINMVTRQVMRRLVNFGIDSGVKAMSNTRDSAGRSQPQADRGNGPSNNSNQTKKQARNAMRMARRMGRF